MQNESFPKWRRALAQRMMAGPTSKTMELVVPRLPAPGALRWFWLDGLAANFYESMLLTFIPLFALAMGATAVEIGWMSALGSLLGTVVLLPGARLAERWGNPHRLVVWAGFVGRLMVLAMVLWPFTGQAGVWGIIAFATLRLMLNQLALPAWTSIAADIVPEEVRGRYFASRNLAMALAAAVSVPLAGELINRVGGLVGFRVDFALAFLLGLAATYFYSRIEVPPREAPVVVRGKRLPIWKRLRQRPNFLRFCFFSAIWNFSLQIAGPFFNVYLVQGVGASTVMVGLVATAATLASLPGQGMYGRLADRWGPRKTVLWSGIFIPLAPMMWMLVSEPWHPTLINLYSGFLWAGFNIALFNFLLVATPDDRRPRYVAFFNTVVGLSNAGGAAAGGWIAQNVSYDMIFFLSGLGRALAIAFFFFFVTEPQRDAERLALQPVEPEDEP